MRVDWDLLPAVLSAQDISVYVLGKGPRFCDEFKRQEKVTGIRRMPTEIAKNRYRKSEVKKLVEEKGWPGLSYEHGQRLRRVSRGSYP